MSTETRSAEIAQAEDLLENMPEAVIEVCGEDNLAELAVLSANLTSWGALTRLPNPFDIEPSPDEPREPKLCDPASVPHVRAIERASALSFRNPGLEEAIQTFEEHTPVVEEAMRVGLQRLFALEGSLRNQWTKRATFYEERKQADSPTPRLEDIHYFYDSLVAWAVRFPSKEDLQALYHLSVVSATGNYVHMAALGARKLPEAAEKLVQTRIKGRHDPDAKRQSRDITETLYRVGEREHPSLKTKPGLQAVGEAQNALSTSRAALEHMEAVGLEVFGAISTAAARDMVDSGNNMWSILCRLQAANQQNLESAADAVEDPEAYRLKAIEVEDYLAEQTIRVNAVLQELEREGLVSISADEETSQRLNTLTEERPLRRAYEREVEEAARRAGNIGLSQEVAPDQDFLRQCAETRKLLDGGNRLDDPLAPRLGKQLHGIRLGKKANKRLGRHEQGLVIAILTNRLDAVIATTERVQAPDADEDVQMRFLKGSAPHQLMVIAGFDLRGSVSKLKQIFDDPHSRNQLLNPLSNSGIKSPVEAIKGIRATIDQLFQKFEPPEDPAGLLY
jgi:hypothetical protein